MLCFILANSRIYINIKHEKVILKINHDSVQLNTLNRPGSVPNLRGATREELQRIVKFWKLDNVEIIAALLERKDIQ